MFSEDNKPFPPVPKELVQALDERFPERSPDPEWSDREVWMRAGERRVVRFLLRKLQEQEEDTLSN